MKVSELKYRELIKKVRGFGFVFRRSTSGSHEIWWNEETRKTCVIPHHQVIASGTIRSIAKQMSVTVDRLVAKTND